MQCGLGLEAAVIITKVFSGIIFETQYTNKTVD